MTGFDAVPDDLRRRAGEVDGVSALLHRAVVAAGAASAPAPFGMLCSFFPALLAPAHEAARAALQHGADTARRLAGAVRASADSYASTDAGVAGTMR